MITSHPDTRPRIISSRRIASDAFLASAFSFDEIYEEMDSLAHRAVVRKPRNAAPLDECNNAQIITAKTI